MPSSFRTSAAAICAAIIPLASQDPRPYTRSLSSDEAINGGTVSMCVEKTTAGFGSCGEVANTFARSPSTAILWTLYPSPRNSSASACPTAPSFPLMDSISTSRRVSETTSMRIEDNLRVWRTATRVLHGIYQDSWMCRPINYECGATGVPARWRARRPPLHIDLFAHSACDNLIATSPHEPCSQRNPFPLPRRPRRTPRSLTQLRRGERNPRRPSLPSPSHVRWHHAQQSRFPRHESAEQLRILRTPLQLPRHRTKPGRARSRSRRSRRRSHRPRLARSRVPFAADLRRVLFRRC